MNIMQFFKKYKNGLDSSPNLTRPTKNQCHECHMLDVFKDYLNDQILEPRALTLTLKPKFLDIYTDEIDIHKYIHEKISKSTLWKRVDYIIRPEFDPNGRLHYHGIIYSDSIEKIAKIVKWWRRTFGYVNRDWNRLIKYNICSNFVRNNLKPCAVKLNTNIKANSCWCHYIFKDYNITGLWTIYNINHSLAGSPEGP